MARPSGTGSRADASSPSVSTKGFDPARTFTPGPWHIFASGHAAEHHDSVEINDPDGLTVAWAQKFVQQYAAQSEANARLIAAAPELYEALRELLVAVRYADPPKDYGNDGNHGPNLCHEARIPVDFVTIAERALAKARGDA